MPAARKSFCFVCVCFRRGGFALCRAGWGCFLRCGVVLYMYASLYAFRVFLIQSNKFFIIDFQIVTFEFENKFGSYYIFFLSLCHTNTHTHINTYSIMKAVTDLTTETMHGVKTNIHIDNSGGNGQAAELIIRQDYNADFENSPKVLKIYADKDSVKIGDFIFKGVERDLLLRFLTPKGYGK